MQSKKTRRTPRDSHAPKGHRGEMRWRYTQVMIRVVSLMAVLALVGGCGGSNPVEPTPPTAPFTQVDLVEGTGATATTGRTVTVTYALWLYRSEQR